MISSMLGAFLIVSGVTLTVIEFVKQSYVTKDTHELIERPLSLRFRMRTNSPGIAMIWTGAILVAVAVAADRLSN